MGFGKAAKHPPSTKSFFFFFFSVFFTGAGTNGHGMLRVPVQANGRQNGPCLRPLFCPTVRSPRVYISFFNEASITRPDEFWRPYCKPPQPLARQPNFNRVDTPSSCVSGPIGPSSGPSGAGGGGLTTRPFSPDRRAGRAHVQFGPPSTLPRYERSDGPTPQEVLKVFQRRPEDRNLLLPPRRMNKVYRRTQ